VAFELSTENTESGLDQLDSRLKGGLQEYIRRYGDKSTGEQSAAGLRRHYDLLSTAAGNVELHVHGLSGHMGALYENDNALIKAAYLLQGLKFGAEADAEGWGIRLLVQPSGSPLLLEGGQGFVPTHSMDQIKSRLSTAVQRAYRRYARSTWKRIPYFRDATPRVSFVKLHNEAYQSDPASPAVAQALLAAADAGIDARHPVLGWEVSSDARIFAHLRPGLPVFTTGPGKLALAHSDQERITIDELCSGTLMLALFVLRHGGFLAADG
jgi:acetylornithine deacetylase/succinyl-diaminopimelate desuccinylase-like protein